MKPKNDFQYEKRNSLVVLRCVLIIFFTVYTSIIAQDGKPIKLSWLGGNPPSLSTRVS